MFADDQSQSAADSYKHVRCGLLHEAQTRGGWTVRVCPSAKMAIDTTAKVVYRDKMQDAFEKFLDWYKEELCRNSEFQRAFIRKFDGLCRE
jgi:hypothetical protein